jgi:uncharacterized protein involved in exopolysaccharide biosynthesis
MTFLRWHRLPWIAGLGCFLAVMTWTAVVTPRYRSTALVRVQDDPSSSGLSDALSAIPGAGMLGLSRDEVESEIGVLTSRRVLDAVIDSLALTVRRPAGERDDVATVVLRSPEDDLDGKLVFTPTDGAAWSVSVRWEESSAVAPSVSSLVPGDTLRIGGMWLRFDPRFASGEAPSSLELTLAPRYEVREALVDRLDVRRQEIGSRLIAISFDDSDRRLAAQVVDRMLAEYLSFVARTERGDLGSTAAELRRQVEAQRVALTDAEEALRRNQERSGLVVPEEQAAAQIKRYTALRAELDAAEVERRAVQGMLTLTETRAGQARSPEAYRQLATYPSLLSNRAIQDLLESLLTLENTRSERQLLLADESRELRQIGTRISEIERSLQRLGSQYLEAIEVRSRSLTAAIDTIDAELATLPLEEMRYIRLLRDRTVLNEGYLLLQKQLRQTELREALRLDQVRIVDTPIIAHPDDPQFPKVWVHLVLALVLGLSVGTAVAAAQRSARPA